MERRTCQWAPSVPPMTPFSTISAVRFRFDAGWGTCVGALETAVFGSSFELPFQLAPTKPVTRAVVTTTVIPIVTAEP